MEPWYQRAKNQVVRTFEDVALMAQVIPAGIALWTKPPAVNGTDLVFVKTVQIKAVATTQEAIGHDACTVFRFRYQRYANKWESCRIAISDQTNRIAHLFTDGWLFGEEYHGSGVLGVGLLTLPITLPLSPVLLAIDAHRTRLERVHGLSRHEAAILNKLKGQMPEELYERLKTAFENTHAYTRWLNRSVTFEEARELLKRYPLFLEEFFVPSESGLKRVNRCGGWLDSEECEVAILPMKEPNATEKLRVLGSVFEGDELEQLLTCYSTCQKEQKTMKTFI